MGPWRGAARGATVTMPEATMNKNGDSERWQHNIGTAREVWRVKSEP